MRSYTITRMPAVVELASGDALDAALDLHELDASLPVEVLDDCLLLPPPYEVWREGRTLRGEEDKPYFQAFLAACSKLAARAIRFSIHEMYVFDWHAFTKPQWAALQSAYESLPGWLGASDLPWWFGTDERKGPCLSASIEPPGLQVGGVLELAVFDDWHRRFLETTSKLPVRSFEW